MINQSFLRVALSQHDLQHDLRFTAIAVDKGVLRYTRERYRQEHGWTVPSHPLETSEIIKELSDENYRQIVHRQKKNDFEEFSLFRLATPTWDIFRLWLIRYYEAQRTIAEGERKLAFLHAGEHDTPIVMMYQGYVQIYDEILEHLRRFPTLSPQDLSMIAIEKEIAQGDDDNRKEIWSNVFDVLDTYRKIQPWEDLNLPFDDHKK